MTKADILNNQFCTAFTREDMTHMPVLDSSPHPTVPEINITENGVYKLLASLNPRKASGPDGIPCRLVREVAEELASALTLLFVKSLDTGQVSHVWEHAIVQPIIKKGDRSQAANYRPISLTCICCKLLEHVNVRSSITAYLDEHKILTDSQHGSAAIGHASPS
ncbi:hypothetical protein HAZT_HAZT002046 [Hyalella azteca]|uniref:Reverse transcriptase domain-containing protein n=1 Tax=Hyalella azteca TaxID=294128 RepID=A0A6A0GQY1_HYAAZ|nr:hypothetical protein HAZT_HAZT002046 [Hyalella azteca]